MSTSPPVVDEQRARRLITASSTMQYRLGLIDYLGHTSMRLDGEGRYLIKPKHSPTVRGMDGLGPDDLIVVDDQGVNEGGGRPPAEVFIHTEIFRRRPDVQVVVHTHQPLAVTMGVLEAPIEPLLHVQGSLVAEPVPLWPCSRLVTTPSLGADLAETLGDHAVAHLQGHGIVSVGATIEEATVNAIHLEQLARINLQALQSGRAPRVIPADEIASLREELAPLDGRWAYYASVTGVDDALLA